jgi:hypothetical protein
MIMTAAVLHEVMVALVATVMATVSAALVLTTTSALAIGRPHAVLWTTIRLHLHRRVVVTMTPTAGTMALLRQTRMPMVGLTTDRPEISHPERVATPGREVILLETMIVVAVTET